ncbi:DegT/DnrJ/EryC1/StrS family aminotransferase [Kitasatospora sp. NPDC101155]|uniref:DegT/DnrJ/EryC1/StrS family aminotransferase n=1 Tax=Kitasatospora sp. NPDC101155 TaxID=3364097 RepID=UPI0037FB2846
MTSPLALLGGKPEVTASGPHFTWPPIDDTTRAKVASQLEESISIPGRSGIVAELEDGLQEYLGVRHAVTTSSGTAALHATYWAARIKPGDEVIVPAWTFHATASPLFHLRAVPVLCETGPDGNIDPNRIEELITPRTRAIMVTHLWGKPADMTDIVAVANAHDQLARLDGYLAGRAEIARYLTGQLARIPGLEVTEMPEGVVPSWYGLTLTYRPDELDGLPIERFHQALIAEGATEFDRPGSTCPMNQLPLYQQPSTLFPGHPHSHRRYKPGDFPVAEHAHAHTIKLPVWHREQDLEVAEQYVRAATKISDHHKELQ